MATINKIILTIISVFIRKLSKIKTKYLYHHKPMLIKNLDLLTFLYLKKENLILIASLMQFRKQNHVTGKYFDNFYLISQA